MTDAEREAMRVGVELGLRVATGVVRGSVGQPVEVIEACMAHHAHNGPAPLVEEHGSDALTGNLDLEAFEAEVAKIVAATHRVVLRAMSGEGVQS